MSSTNPSIPVQPFILSQLGSVHGAFSPTPVGPDIEQRWRIRNRTGGEAQYFGVRGTLVGTLEKKTGIGAWSIQTGELIWSDDTFIAPEYGPRYAIAGSTVYAYQESRKDRPRLLPFALETGEQLLLEINTCKVPIGVHGDEVLITHLSEKGASVRRIGLHDRIDRGEIAGFSWITPHMASYEGDIVALMAKDANQKVAYVTRIDPNTGERKWVYDNQKMHLVCQVGCFAVLGPSSYYIPDPAVVIDLRSGEKLWELPKRFPFHYENCYLYADKLRDLLAVVDTSGEHTTSVWCRSLRTGELKWEHRTMAESFGYPIAEAAATLWVTGDILWHVDATDFDKRFLVARNVTTGAELNRIRMPGRSRRARIECADAGILVVRDGQSLYGYASR